MGQPDVVRRPRACRAEERNRRKDCGATSSPAGSSKSSGLSGSMLNRLRLNETAGQSESVLLCRFNPDRRRRHNSRLMQSSRRPAVSASLMPPRRVRRLHRAPPTAISFPVLYRRFDTIHTPFIPWSQDDGRSTAEADETTTAISPPRRPQRKGRVPWLDADGPPTKVPEEGRVGGGLGGCRSRESLLPAAFALMPVPQSRP